MKKTVLLLCVIALVPLIFCSCLEKEVQSIELSETDLTMTVDDSLSVQAKIYPADAKSKALDWISSDNKVVTVSDGTLKAKSAGKAVVTVKSENNVKSSCNVTVENKEITSISLNNNDVSVKVGKKVQLLAKVQPSDAPSDDLEWVSNDDNIAIVNSEGYVTGVKAGVVNVTCKSPNGKEASCTVTVKSDKKASTSTAQKATDPPANVYIINPSGNSGSVGAITTLNSTPSQIGNAYKSDFVFYDSGYRRLSAGETYGMSSEQIQHAVNEIYARHGRKFQTPSISAYFKSTAWYIENPNYSDYMLNDIEVANISLLSNLR